MQKSQKLKVKTAGPLTASVVYPRIYARDGITTRNAKSKMTSAAQKFINAKNQRSKLEFLLAANLKKGDFFVVLTYDDMHLPPNRKAANNNMVAFIRKLRETQAPTAYFYNIEGSHYDDKPEENHRLHHHLYITDDGYSIKKLEKLWGRGHVYGHRLKFDAERTFGALASYMIKEAQEHPGKRAWHASKKLKKPEVKTVTVPADFILEVPKDDTILVLENSGIRETCYGRYQELKTLALDGYTTLAVKQKYNSRAEGAAVEGTGTYLALTV